MTPEQEQLFDKLESKLEALEEHGMTLEDALESLQQRERAAAGPPDLVKNMWPAQRVLQDAISAANSQKADETVAALDRYEMLNAAIAAELPAARIIVHCERALTYLSQEDLLDEAGVEMALAYRVADRTKFATLVPENVISLIQNNARGQISAGRPREASEVIRTVLNTCSGHESLARMERIEAAIAGARDALGRGVWPVVDAELYEADRALTDLAEKIRPGRWNLTEDLEGISTDFDEAGEPASAEPVEGAEAAEEEAAEAGEETAPEAEADTPETPEDEEEAGERDLQ